MYALLTIFSMPADTDWEAQRRTARERAALYEATPGLRAKAFVISHERNEYGGQYIFDSRADLDRFLASDTFQGAIAKFGQPRLTIYEVPAYVAPGATVQASR